MNIVKPLIERIRPLLESHLPEIMRRPARRPRRIAVQLEFPWPPKR